MTWHLVSFTNHPSASLEGGPAQNYSFYLSVLPLLEAVADNFPTPCIQPTLFHHLVVVHVMYTRVRDKKSRLCLCNACETQVELRFAGSCMVPQSSASADPSGFLQRCTSHRLRTMALVF